MGLTPPHEWANKYKHQEPFWGWFANKIRQIGRVDLLVLNGDLIDGPGRRDSVHLLTTDIVEQVDMVREVVSLIKAKKKVIVRGTGYHVDTNGNMENFVGKELDIEVLDDYRAEIHGRKFHWRHHVGRSDIPYGKFTQMGKEQINDILRGFFEEYEPFDIGYRAHVHYCGNIGEGDPSKGRMREVWTAPAMCMRSAVGVKESSYVRRLRTWKYDVGFLYTEVDTTGEVFTRPQFMKMKQEDKGIYECLTAEKGSRKTKSQ